MPQRRLRYIQIVVFIGFFSFFCVPIKAEEVARVGSHVFYSSFWINLYERLRHEAGPESKEVHDDFSDDEKKVWNEAVEFYRREVAPKHPVFSQDLIGWQNTIVKIPDDAEPTGIPAEMTQALTRAAVVYRKAQWKADDSANRFWISIQSTLLRETGAEIKNDIVKAYGVNWPQTLHVEVVPFADPFGGYTPAAVKGLFLTVISSRDPGYQNFGGLEMLFHEPLHHFDDQLDAMLNDAAKKVNKRIPRNLDHAILFYTAGEMTRRALLKRGVVYTPVADEVAQRAWRTYIDPLKQYWQAYLDGKMNRSEALQRLLTAVGQS